MNNLLIDKQTEQQKQENNLVLNNFLLAITSQDLVYMETLLDNRGLYLGRKTKWVFLAWLRNKFEAVNGKSIIHDCDTFHSMEYYPGNIGMRITYLEFDPETCETGDTLLEMKLIALVSKGKIKTVFECKRTVARDQITNMITNN
jgi:hypothetical protein